MTIITFLKKINDKLEIVSFSTIVEEVSKKFVFFFLNLTKNITYF